MHIIEHKIMGNNQSGNKQVLEPYEIECLESLCGDNELSPENVVWRQIFNLKQPLHIAVPAEFMLISESLCQKLG